MGSKLKSLGSESQLSRSRPEPRDSGVSLGRVGSCALGPQQPSDTFALTSRSGGRDIPPSPPPTPSDSCSFSFPARESSSRPRVNQFQPAAPLRWKYFGEPSPPLQRLLCHLGPAAAATSGSHMSQSHRRRQEDTLPIVLVMYCRTFPLKIRAAKAAPLKPGIGR